MSHYIEFPCSNCGAKLEVEAEIEEHGSYPSIHPLSTDPGCGCSWYAKESVVCESCKHTHTADWLGEDEQINDEVQKRDAEPRDFYDR